MKLQHKDLHSLKQAYRSAQKFDSLELHFEEAHRAEAISATEEAGWIGLLIDPLKGSFGLLKAFKGKHGPCRDGQQSSRYLGGFLGVWDDDHHLILKESPLPVCIKTGKVHGHEHYQILLDVSPKDAPEDVGEFDCDDLQKNLDRLEELLPENTSPIHDPVSVYYPGPFSKAITHEGHLLLRGQCSLISKNSLQDLKADGVIPFESSDAVVRKLHDHSPTVQNVASSSATDLDWSSLKKISPGLKTKLIAALDRDRDILILTGSDPQEEQGCCPSEDVGSANALVRAGLLKVVEHNHDGEGCSITLYGWPKTFSEEAEEDTFRNRLRMELQPKWTSPLRVLLLICVALALLSGTARLIEQRLQEKVSLESILTESQTHHLVLFQELPRCPPCIAIESLVGDLAKKENLPFTTLDLNDGRFLDAVEAHDLFSATLFILKRQGEEVQASLHYPAAELWPDPEAFERNLRDALGLE